MPPHMLLGETSVELLEGSLTGMEAGCLDPAFARFHVPLSVVTRPCARPLVTSSVPLWGATSLRSAC